MTSRRRSVLVAMLLVAFSPVAASEPACDVSGTWQDNFGTLFLRMAPGGSVSGNYTWQNGTMSGVMDGRFLNGTWSEEPTFAAPRDAGRYSFEFSDDCMSFTGTYYYAESPESPVGSWSGTRVATPEPAERLPLFPACDPRGEWQTNHGRVYFFSHGGISELSAQWLLEDEVGTLDGDFSGTRFEGRWKHPGRAGGSEGHFVVVFDERCETFRGDWTDDESIHQWNGALTEPMSAPDEPTADVPTDEPAPEPPATTPTESTDEPPAPETPTEHLPGVGENPNDPVGIPGAGVALGLSIAIAAALMLRRPRAR